MLDSPVVGWVLVVIGVGFVVLGFAAAAKKLFSKGQDVNETAFDPEKWAKLGQVIVDFVKAAPEWLLLSTVGMGLIFWGSNIIAKAGESA